jgi:hypothetical protein
MAAPLDVPLRPDAARLEAGNPSLLGLLVLDNALDVLEGLDPKAVLAHAHELGGELIEGLRRLGLPVITPEAPDERAGNVCFLATDGQGLAARLAERFPGVYAFLLNKGYVDEVYDEAIVQPIKALSEGALWQGLDATVIDGWGRPIVIQRYTAGVNAEERSLFTRLVSAGPDGVINTPTDVAAPSKAVCGDDIVLYLRIADQRP